MKFVEFYLHIPKILCSIKYVKKYKSYATFNLTHLLTRPHVSLEDLLNVCPEAKSAAMIASEVNPDVLVQTEIQLKYEGYIEREKEQANKLARLEDLVIPESVNYDEMKSVSLEAKEKLKKIQPRTIGQAARVSGVSPSDISVLLIYLGR